MSVGAQSVSEASVAAQPLASGTTTKPPPRRTITAKADAVAQPEPR